MTKRRQPQYPRARIYFNEKSKKNPKGDDLWWVVYGTWKQSATSHRECVNALDDYRLHRQCLYAGCAREGNYVDGLGYGFRFCQVHITKAQKVLKSKVFSQKRNARLLEQLNQI